MGSSPTPGTTPPRGGHPLDTYLDIETTGLSPAYDEITVIGIYTCSPRRDSFTQLVGPEICAGRLLTALSGTSTLYTYNGSRFDLPFIHTHLGIDLADLFEHRDLMYDCWRCNLYGGFKAVERYLGIERRLQGVDGLEAVRLWWRYVYHADRQALEILLAYNREDVVNLRALRERLPSAPP